MGDVARLGLGVCFWPTLARMSWRCEGRFILGCRPIGVMRLVISESPKNEVETCGQLREGIFIRLHVDVLV
jgi:hypothetical protein